MNFDSHCAYQQTSRYIPFCATSSSCTRCARFCQTTDFALFPHVIRSSRLPIYHFGLINKPLPFSHHFNPCRYVVNRRHAACFPVFQSQEKSDTYVYHASGENVKKTICRGYSDLCMHINSTHKGEMIDCFQTKQSISCIYFSRHSFSEQSKESHARIECITFALFYFTFCKNVAV